MSKKALDATLGKEQENNRKAIQELEDKLADQLKRLQEYAENIRNLERENKDQAKDLKDESEKVQKLTDNKQQLENNRDELQRELESQKRRIDDLENDVLNRDGKITQLTRQAEETDDHVRKLDKDIKGIVLTWIIQIFANLALEESLDKEKNKFKQLQAEKDDTDETLRNLETKYSHLDRDFHKETQQRKEAENEVLKLKSAIDELTRKLFLY